MPADPWLELQKERFSELSFDCGNAIDPGVIFGEDLRDWSDKATTPDQYRIERYIDRHDLREKRILHIGIGNSGLAKRFHSRVKEIVGTTIDEPEISVARSLALSNYSAVLHNKYGGRNDQPPGQFDFIVDNNPTSPCCCISHLASLFAFYDAKLAPSGQIVTDREGLEWVPDESCPRWSFDFEDIGAVAKAAGFSAYRAGRYVYVLSRSSPASPGIVPLLRHKLRRVIKIPSRIISNGPRAVLHILRRALGRIGISSTSNAPGGRFAHPNRKR